MLEGPQKWHTGSGMPVGPEGSTMVVLWALIASWAHVAGTAIQEARTSGDAAVPQPLAEFGVGVGWGASVVPG